MIVVTLTFILATPANSYIGLGPIASESSIEWIEDDEAGFAEARVKTIPIVMDFSADWCAPCGAMDEHVWTNQQVGTAAEGIVAIRVDYDRRKKLRRRYKVRAIPTMVFFDPWGNELFRREGYTAVEEVLRLLEVTQVDFNSIAPLHERLNVDTDPENGASLARIGTFYQRNKWYEASEDFFKRALKSVKNGKTDPVVAEEAYVGLGVNCLVRQDPKKAKKQFERCIKKLPPGPYRPDALFGLVVARSRMGDIEEAEQYYKQLSTEYPDYGGLDAAQKEISKAKAR
jgi:thioredoxin 1